METDFLGIVMRCYAHLVTNYGFLIKKSDISERDPDIDGEVEFVSSTTFVSVSGEQGSARTIIGRIQDDRYRFFLDPWKIREYHILSESDKKLLCSLDPKDDPKAKIIKRQVEIIRIPNPSESTADYISAKLSDYSKVLLEFAEPFLRGNFSQWLEIYEYKVNSSRAARLRLGKQEFVRTVSKNKGEQVSIFQDDFDYLEQLKREYGKENC